MNKSVVLIVLVLLGLGTYMFLGDNREENAPAVEDSENVLGEPIISNVATEEVAYYQDTKGYLAVPEGEGPFPALVFIYEWWGLNDNIRNIAEDFAEQGYVALAVDLYSGESATTSEGAGALAGAVRENVGEAFNNLNAAVAYLESREDVNGEELASVGWCFGGQWAYEMAKNDLGIDASVMYYGRFMPEDDLSMMRADILGHFGEEDRSIAVDDVREFEKKFKLKQYVIVNG
jgi:carboxymethylenebutenolidase